jgi:hypothetical protein
MHYFVLAGFWLMTLVALAGCSRPAHPGHVDQNLGGLVTNMVQHAQSGDAVYFDSLLRGPDAGEAPKLMEMIRGSGMLTNYMTRVQTNSTADFRLGYHDLARGCNFQVDLLKDGLNWRLKRIWFCRPIG